MISSMSLALLPLDSLMTIRPTPASDAAKSLCESPYHSYSDSYRYNNRGVQINESISRLNISMLINHKQITHIFSLV